MKTPKKKTLKKINDADHDALRLSVIELIRTDLTSCLKSLNKIKHAERRYLTEYRTAIWGVEGKLDYIRHLCKVGLKIDHRKIELKTHDDE